MATFNVSATLSSTPSIAVASGARGINGSGAVQNSTDSSAVGTTVRTVNGSGTPQGTSTVTGLGDRQYSGIGTPKSSSSTVSGSANLVISASGTLQASSSTTNGSVERELAVNAGAPKAAASIISATVIRGMNANGTPQGAASTVTSTTKRTVTLPSVVLQNTRSLVVGGASRKVNSDGPSANGAVNSGPSTVVATGVRTSKGPGAIQGTSTVSGVAEREVEDNLITAALTATASTIAGVASREINVTGPTVASSSTIVGAGDRGSNATGSLQNSSPSLVTGVTERSVVLQSGIAQGSSSTATGLAEREVKEDTGALKVGPASTVNGTSVIIGRNAKPTWTTTPSRVFGNARVEFTATGIFNRPTINNIVAGVAEREIDDNAGNSLQPTTNNIIAGVAEREITGTGVIVDNSNLVAGVAVKKKTFFATGLDTRPTTNNLVTGVAEREVEENAITQALQGPDNLVDGLAERIVVLEDGVAQTTEAVVAGIAEREIEDEIHGNVSTALEASSSRITAATNQGRNATGILVDSSSTVVGTSENMIIGAGTLVQSSNSTLSGVAEREVENNAITVALTTSPSVTTGVAEKKQTVGGNLRPNTDNLVAGVAEREIVSEPVALQGPDSKTRPPFNKAERIMVISGINGFMLSGQSSITANAHVGRVTSGAFKPTDQNFVTGLGEREINAPPGTGVIVDDFSDVTGSGVRTSNATGIEQTDPSEVTGVAERQINAVGVLVVTDPAVVTGAAEREVNLQSGIAQVDASDVAGLSERTVVATGTLQDNSNLVTGLAEVINTAAGAIEASSSAVVGAGVRVVHNEPTIDISGDTANSPNETDSQVEYDGAFGSRNPYYIKLTDVSVAAYEGIYQPARTGQVVSESGLDYNRVSSTAYNAYFKFRGTDTVDILVFNTTRNAWYASTGSAIEFLSNSSSITDAALSQVLITNSSMTKPYGSEFGPVAGPDNLVGGVAERIIVEVDASVKAPNNIVNGVAERKSVANGLIVTDITIEVVANIGRLATPDLVTGVSKVDGVSENIIVDKDATPTADISKVSGVAEREINLLDGIEQVPDLSDVVGGGVRHANLLSGIEQVQDPSDVAGVAERTVVLERGIVPVLANVFGPDTAFYVSYSGNDIVISGLSGQFNGTYEFIQGANFEATGFSTPQQYSVNTSYNVWQKDNGNGSYDVIVWRDLVSRWLVFAESTDVRTRSDGDDFDDFAGTAVAAEKVSIEVLGSTKSLASGVAERTIVEVEADLTASEVGISATTGDAERVVPGAGVLTTSASTITAVSEREIIGSGTLPRFASFQSQVTGVAERTINLFQSPKAQPSQVDGLSERIINYFTGAAGTFPGPGSSSATGLAERVVTLDSGLFSGESDSEQSTIIGISNRIINLEQGLIQDSDTEQSHVTGLSERIISLLQGIEMPDDDSKVIGLSERIIVLEQGLIQDSDLEQSHVVSVAERTIVLEQGLVQDSDLEQSHVVGVAEREVEDNLVTAELVPTTNNLVAGVAERIVVLEQGIEMPDDVSVVSGLSERIIVLEQGIDMPDDDSKVDNGDPITIDRFPIVDAVEAGSSTVASVDADRVVDQIVTGDHTVFTGLAPNSSDAEVSYSSEKLVLTGMSNAVYDGTYKLLGRHYTVATTGFNNYTLSENEDYLVYHRYGGPGVYYIVAFRTTNNSWTVFQTTHNPEAEMVFYDGLELENVAGPSLTVATESESRPYPYRVPVKTENNLVDGLSERTINLLSGVAQGDESHIVGSGFRTSVNELPTNLVSQQSTTITATGSFAERIVEDEVHGQSDIDLDTTPSLVAGISERIITGAGGVQADTSIVGAAERIVKDLEEGIIMPDSPSLVTGLAERIIENNQINQDIQSAPSTTTGVSERTINLFQGIFSNVSDSDQSHTNNELFPSQGFRTSNLLVGILSNDEDEEQSHTLAETIDGNGDRVIPSAPVRLQTTSSITTGVAERTVQDEIHGQTFTDMQSGPSSTTGVAERIIELEKGIGIPSYTVTGGTGPILVAEPNDRPGYPAYGDLYQDSSEFRSRYKSYVDELTGNVLLGVGSRGPTGDKEFVYKPFDPDSYGFWWLTTGIDSAGRITWQAVQDSDNWILRREAERYGLDPINDVAPSVLFLQDSGLMRDDRQILDGNHHIWMGAIMQRLGHANTGVLDGNNPTETHNQIGAPGSDRANKYLDSIGSTGFGANNTLNKSFYGHLYEMGTVEIGHGDSVIYDRYLDSNRYWDPAYQTTRAQFEARYARGEKRITLGAQNSYDSDMMVANWPGGNYGIYPGPDGNNHPGPDWSNTGLGIPFQFYGIPAPAVHSLYGNDSQYIQAGWEPTTYGLNPDYDSSRHATDPSEIGGVAERKITGGGSLVATPVVPSTVQGIAERIIENNEITQEIRPTQHNLVTGVAERIVVVEEGVNSADERSEQSTVTAIVYQNLIEQQRIHKRRKFVLREERMKTFISRQTPTG